NRVYTEWYRNQGYDFTITSSTAFDHKWIHDRNIFESISVIVDEIFDSYLSRPGVKQPILTQYCDGKRVQCPDWMALWQIVITFASSYFSSVKCRLHKKMPESVSPLLTLPGPIASASNLHTDIIMHTFPLSDKRFS